MDTFFCSDIKEGLSYLPEGESHHAARVLRKQPGDEVRVMDGKGTVGTGVFEEVHKRACVVRVADIVVESPPNYYLHIAIAPTKNLDRLEWFLEKSTELGVQKVTPILCQHSERKVVRKDRLAKVMMSATKQSLRAFLPILDDLTPFSAFLERLTAKNDHRYMAYCGDDVELDILDVPKQGHQVVVLIGPEGGFSQEEFDLAVEKGFVGLKLGRTRLRTETAGVYVAAVFRQ